MLSLESCITRVTEDESLRSTMDDETAAIWLHAAGEHLRLCNRRGEDLNTPLALVLAVLRLANAMLKTGAVVRPQEKP